MPCSRLSVAAVPTLHLGTDNNKIDLNINVQEFAEPDTDKYAATGYFIDEILLEGNRIKQEVDKNIKI